jgi:hypothetical protein
MEEEHKRTYVTLAVLYTVGIVFSRATSLCKFYFKIRLNKRAHNSRTALKPLFVF